jgi:hypothetical protein
MNREETAMHPKNWTHRLIAYPVGILAMVAFFTPIMHASSNPSLYDAIVEAGLTTNLKLVLDAGDSQSYDGTSQKWLDRSGGGYDFFLGTNGTVQSTDPTFNGTAGRLTASEYFSTDGGDYFSYDTSIETWMQNMGKGGRVFTVLGVFYIPSDTDSTLVSTRGSTAADNGWSLSYIQAFDKFAFQFIDSGGTVISLGLLVAPTITTPGLYFYAISGTLTNGAAYNTHLNGTNNSGTLSATAIASNPTNNMKILARGDVSVTGASGTRIHALALWEGTALSQANFTTLWNRLRGRFGL